MRDLRPCNEKLYMNLFFSIFVTKYFARAKVVMHIKSKPENIMLGFVSYLIKEYITFLLHFPLYCVIYSFFKLPTYQKLTCLSNYMILDTNS